MLGRIVNDTRTPRLTPYGDYTGRVGGVRIPGWPDDGKPRHRPAKCQTIVVAALRYGGEGALGLPASETRTIGNTRERARPLHGVSWTWFGLVVAGVVYGSLLPFEFSAPAFSMRLSTLSIRDGFSAAPLGDVLTNLGLYVPVGLFFVVCGKTGRRGRVFRALPAVLLGGALSFLLETVQSGVAGRVSSRLDVLLNSIGTCAGALLGLVTAWCWPFLAGAWRHRWAVRPFSCISVFLAVGLFCYHLTPFDFVTTPEALRASVHSARWDLSALDAHLDGKTKLSIVSGQLGRAFWFALFGFVGALAARKRERSSRKAFTTSVRYSIGLVVTLQLMKLLSCSHNFKLVELTWCSLFAVLGAWIAGKVSDQEERSVRVYDGRTVLPTPVLAVLLVLEILVILFSDVGPLSALASAVPLRIEWLPFDELRFASLHRALEVTLVFALCYGTVGLTLAVLAGRLGIMHRGSFTVAASGLFALAVAMLHAATGSGTVYLTGPAVAVAAAFVIGRWNGTHVGGLSTLLEAPPISPGLRRDS